MKYIKTEVFRFNELTDDSAKERARDWWRSQTDQDQIFAEQPLAEAQEYLKLMGYWLDTHQVPLCSGKTREAPNIWWSGFWQQGSGACFEGKWYGRDMKPIEELKKAPIWDDSHPEKATVVRVATELMQLYERYKAEFPDMSATITKHDHHYAHENTVRFELHDCIDEDSPTAVDDFTAAENAVIGASRDFMKLIYRQLEESYEAYNSNDYVDDCLQCNNYLFTAGGAFVNAELEDVIEEEDDNGSETEDEAAPAASGE